MLALVSRANLVKHIILFPITFNYLLDIAISSKDLARNNFITDDCTKDAEERPKELYGRMMDDSFAINACVL